MLSLLSGQRSRIRLPTCIGLRSPVSESEMKNLPLSKWDCTSLSNQSARQNEEAKSGSNGSIPARSLTLLNQPTNRASESGGRSSLMQVVDALKGIVGIESERNPVSDWKRSSTGPPR